jgi:hypothetical protein
MAIELVSYDDLKDLLDLEEDAITGYPSLSIIRASVTSAIEEYLGRELESKSRTDTLYVEGTPTSMIYLPAIPVTSVTSLVVTWSDDTETYTVNNDFEITGYGLKFYASVSNVSIAITYVGGMSTVPDAVKRAALLQTAYEFQSKDQIGAESVSTDGGYVSRPPLGLLPEVKRILNRFKHPLMMV